MPVLLEREAIIELLSFSSYDGKIVLVTLESLITANVACGALSYTLPSVFLARSTTKAFNFPMAM